MREILDYLQEHLGREVTAYLSGADDLKAFELWAQGIMAEARDLPGMRLRSAHEAVCALIDAYGSPMARAWLFGMNPMLDDEAPAYVLRHSQSPDDWRLVVDAAQDVVWT